MRLPVWAALLVKIVPCKFASIAQFLNRLRLLFALRFTFSWFILFNVALVLSPYSLEVACHKESCGHKKATPIQAAIESFVNWEFCEVLVLIYAEKPSVGFVSF